MRYQTVIFDMDGTLVDTGAGILESLRYAIDKHRLPKLDEASLRYFIGPPLRESFLHFYALQAEVLEAVVRDYRLHNEEYGLKKSTVFPGIIELLETLRKQNVQLWIASTKNKVFVDTTLCYHSLRHYFAGVCACEMDGSHGNKAELIADVLQLSHSTSQQTIMIGDRHQDAQGALENHLGVIGVLWSGSEKTEFCYPNVRRTVQTPQELLQVLQE